MGSDSYSRSGMEFHIQLGRRSAERPVRQLESQPLDSGSLEKWLFMAPCVRSMPVVQHFPLYLTHKQSWRRAAVRPKMKSSDELN